MRLLLDRHRELIIGLSNNQTGISWLLTFFSGSASNPLSFSTRANSPARARSWSAPVKKVILLPLLPPRPKTQSKQAHSGSFNERHTGSTDPMDVLLHSQRKRIVNDRLDLGYIQPPRRNISSDQQRRLGRLELVQRLHALRLAKVPVDSKRMEPACSERLGDAIAFFLVERKDEDSVRAGCVGLVSEFFESLEETAVFVAYVVKDFNDCKINALVCLCSWKTCALTLLYAAVGLEFVFPDCYADRISLECAG